MKRTMYTEVSYALGLVFLSIATALMTLSDFGVSMVVAPAYLIHLKVHETLPFFTFGMAEYMLQTVIIVLLVLVMRRLKWSYLFSFVTAVLYGLLLDGALLVCGLLPFHLLVIRIAGYVGGMLLCSLAVALLFHTYISPEAYELFVKEVAEKISKPIPKVKTVYDCVSCLIAVILSFLFFGFGVFEGVKWGTILCALLNGYIIGSCTKMLEKRFDFKDAFAIRQLFDK